MKLLAIGFFILTIIFLFLGITQSFSEHPKPERLKPDLSNLSKQKLVSIKLEEVIDTNVNLRIRNTTHDYMVIKTGTHKFALVTTAGKSKIVKGQDINIILERDNSLTFENKEKIKSLLNRSLSYAPEANLTKEDIDNIIYVRYYSDFGKTALDYWAWIAFIVCLFFSIGFYGKA